MLAAGEAVARRRRRPGGTPHWWGGGRGCASTSASTASAWPAGVTHETFCEIQNQVEKPSSFAFYFQTKENVVKNKCAVV